jgi:hypothetical protein
VRQVVAAHHLPCHPLRHLHYHLHHHRYRHPALLQILRRPAHRKPVAYRSRSLRKRLSRGQISQRSPQPLGIINPKTLTHRVAVICGSPIPLQTATLSCATSLPRRALAW